MAKKKERTPVSIPTTRIGIGLLSALIAGALVGIIESIVVVRSVSELHEWWLFVWSAIFYGLIALPIGFGFGVLGAILSSIRKKEIKPVRIYSFYLSITFTFLLLIIGRFRIIRDYFTEQSPGLVFNVELLIAAVVLFLILHQVIFRALFRVRWFSRLTTADGTITSWVIIIVLAAVVSFVGGRSGAEEADESIASSSDGGNVLLIIIDTLRADHLSCYGYEAIQTTAFDRLAADGILYNQAISQASWTKASIASILTGLYPSTHQAIHKVNILPDDVVTIAEVFEQEGYLTIGLPNNENITSARNFQQGFQYYVPLEPDFFFYATESAFHLTFYNQLRLIRERFLVKGKRVEDYYQDAYEVNRHATEWIDRIEGDGFFFFLHYMEPHDPYFPHPYDGTGYARVNNPNPPPEMARTYLDVYDGEIAYLDQYLGELIAYLEEKGLYDDLLIVLTSDHGEEFYEHEGWWHGTTLYEEQINVPLIIKLPGNEHAGMVVDDLVRLIDIAPTILTVTGFDIPPLMQGSNVLPDSTGGVSGHDFVFSEEELEGNVLHSIRGSEWKLIIANEGNPRGLDREELYDLSSDPLEKNNLSGEKADMVADLRGQALETLSQALAVSVEAQEKEHGDIERERLKALGYVQ
jgi:arylsulfatase A-like enzyme